MLLADMSRQIKIQAEANGNNREEIERRGELQLMSADINFARYLFEQSNDPAIAYAYLAGEGDGYAKLAMGVAKGNSISGQVAVNYLTNVALDHNKPLTEEKLKEIYNDMFLGYLDILQKRLDNNSFGVIYGDINHKEAGEFHKSIFEKHGLPASAWTLEPVFGLMPENQREGHWQNILDSGGNPFDELEIAKDTYFMMIDKRFNGSRSTKLAAAKWIDATVNIDNIGVIVGGVSDALIDDVSENLRDLLDWYRAIPMSECYPNSMLCEMNWRPFAPESLIADSFAENHRFNNSEFGYNAPMPSRYLTDYHMDRPSYGLPESGLFGGSSYNSPFNSSFSPSSGIDRLANMMSSNRSLGEFGFGDFYSPSRSFDFGASSSFGGFGSRW